MARTNQDASVKELLDQKASALLLSIGEGAITTDERARIQRVNKAALDILGFKENAVVGQWFPSIFEARTSDGNVIELIDRPITRAFLTGKPVTEKTYYTHQNGSLVPVILTVSPLLLNNRPIGAVEVFRDITQETEVDRMKSEFISLASHQLRTPLSAIKIYTHMLADGLVGPPTVEQKEFLDIILSSTDRMNDLIDTLLDITRIEAGKLQPELVHTRLDTIIRDLELEFAPVAELNNITLAFKTRPAPIQTDPILIKEVFANLISNSLKYTPAGGKILVTLDIRENEYFVSVKDSGYGIPEALHKYVFTKFFRASNIVMQDTEGTGLGLYLIKQIAEILGGKLWFTSQENKGTTFCFTIPRQHK